MSDYRLAGVPRLGAYRSVESSVARQGFREILDEASLGGRRIMITRHGSPVAAVVSLRDFEKLRALDQEIDRRMMATRQKSAEGSIPFADFAVAALAGAGEGATEGLLPLGRVALAIGEEFAGDPASDMASRVARIALDMLRTRYGPGHRFTAEEAMEATLWALESLRESAVENRNEETATVMTG
jgi:prevent-host-death family protein